MTNHDDHVTSKAYVEGCERCEAEGEAVDWLLNVRRFGLDKANRMEDDRLGL